MHNDQKRVEEVLMPFIAERISSNEGVEDCTILNRALIQGADPLFLMLTCETQFKDLCQVLGLSPEESRKAIERAHWFGPATLLEGKGLPPKGSGKTPPVVSVPLKQREEALWLILASVSDCEEGGYSKSVSILERFQRVNSAVSRLESLVSGFTEYLLNPIEIAMITLKKFQDQTTFLEFPKELTALGVPTFEVVSEDHGFYVRYKAGQKVVGRLKDNLLFVGTTPDTTLEAEGIRPGKKLSEHFGIIFLES